MVKGNAYDASSEKKQSLLKSVAGNRPYYVYTPERYQVGMAVPLLVMLHGCAQSAKDFALGTQMNALAKRYNFIVVYPEQTASENSNRCWNWFTSANQVRERGEPNSIVNVVRSIVEQTSQWTIDANRIYVAGISAGAAMASILGAAYPELFAALGIHSGIEYQAASNFISALRIMRRGGPDATLQGRRAYEAMGSLGRSIPTIVFHGMQDNTVAPINGEQTVRQWMQTNRLASNGVYQADFLQPDSVKTGQVPGGHSYTVQCWSDNTGKEVQAYWKVQGLKHGWSGGSLEGSYTDPLGPDASLAMYQFFMAHPMKEAPASLAKDGSLWEKVRRAFSGLMESIEEAL